MNDSLSNNQDYTFKPYLSTLVSSHIAPKVPAEVKNVCQEQRLSFECGNKIYLKCLSCNLFICSSCYSTNHLECPVAKINDLGKDWKGNVKDLQEQINIFHMKKADINRYQIQISRKLTERKATIAALKQEIDTLERSEEMFGSYIMNMLRSNVIGMTNSTTSKLKKMSTKINDSLAKFDAADEDAKIAFILNEHFSKEYEFLNDMSDYCCLKKQREFDNLLKNIKFMIESTSSDQFESIKSSITSAKYSLNSVFSSLDITSIEENFQTSDVVKSILSKNLEVSIVHNFEISGSPEKEVKIVETKEKVKDEEEEIDLFGYRRGNSNFLEIKENMFQPEDLHRNLTQQLFADQFTPPQTVKSLTKSAKFEPLIQKQSFETPNFMDDRSFPVIKEPDYKQEIRPFINDFSEKFEMEQNMARSELKRESNFFNTENDDFDVLAVKKLKTDILPFNQLKDKLFGIKPGESDIKFYNGKEYKADLTKMTFYDENVFTNFPQGGKLVMLNDYLVILGGKYGNKVSNRVAIILCEIFEGKALFSVQTQNSMKSLRYNHNAIFMKDRGIIIVNSGLDQIEEPLMTTEVCNVDDFSWKVLDEKMNKVRLNAVMAYVNKRYLLTLGGHKRHLEKISSYNNDYEILDMDKIGDGYTMHSLKTNLAIYSNPAIMQLSYSKFHVYGGEFLKTSTRSFYTISVDGNGQINTYSKLNPKNSIPGKFNMNSFVLLEEDLFGIYDDKLNLVLFDVSKKSFLE